MSERSKVWLLAAGGVVFAQAVASWLLPQGFPLAVLSDTAQCVLLLSGIAAISPNLVRSRGRTRLFWMLMSLGLGFWLCYQLMWSYFEVVLRQDVPDAFAGDIVLFLHVVPMMAALALRPHASQDDRTFKLGALDFALLLVWWIYLYLFSVIPWQYAYSDELAYGRSLNALYLTEKMVFLSGLAILWFQSKNRWRAIYAHWFGASLMYALSSYVANWAIEKHFYYSGSFYDLPLAASMAWLTGIGLVARDSAPKEEGAKPGPGHGVWIARLGMIAIFSLPLFATWSVLDNGSPARVRNFRMALTLVAMMVMGAMVFLRQHLLDRELLRLLRASRQSFEDLKRLQAQLVQSEKLASLAQLVGGAAHELNNPLTVMLGYSDLLASSPLSGEQRVLAGKISRQVRRTKALVSSLLSFAKQVPAEKTLLDVNTIVQTAVKLSQPQLHAHNVEARTNLAASLARVIADSNQLLQVCLHITNNAMHALEEVGGGLLEVSTRQQDDFVVLEFADNGPGACEPERVFDPFYTTRPVGQGTGLGLSACYGIIQEHKGRILCENRPQGGAIFRIELPVEGSTPRDEVVPEENQGDFDSRAAATLPLHPSP